MPQNLDSVYLCLSFLVKTVVLAATWADTARRKAMKKIAAMPIDEKDKEIIFLQEKVSELEAQVSILKKQLKKDTAYPRYSLQERLHVIWHMEYFKIPQSKVTNYFGIARSTFYRWLKKIDDRIKYREPVNKTPVEIAMVVFEIARKNVNWGRVRIANQLALLNVFLASSTVHNILNRPEPKPNKRKKETSGLKNEKKEPRSIPAWYPNHIWSLDCTTVLSWGLWPTYLLVIIDQWGIKHRY